MFKRKTKPPKPQAIASYKISYLDKRSKQYHKIVMTAFAGVFGLAGAAYLFSSKASGASDTGATNNNVSYILLAAALVLAASVMLFSLYLALRQERK